MDQKYIFHSILQENAEKKLIGGIKFCFSVKRVWMWWYGDGYEMDCCGEYLAKVCLGRRKNAWFLWRFLGIL